MVSDSELVERLQEILRNADLETTTPGSIRRQMEAEFGVDLSGKKAYLRSQIDLFIETLISKEDDNADEKEGDVVKQVRAVPESDLAEEDDEQQNEEEDDEQENEEEDDEQENEEEEDEETERMQERATTEKKKKRGGFSKVYSLSPKLQAVVGEAELPRTEVVKRMWIYIREKNLQDPNNKRNIVCDDAFNNLFRVKTINMFQMNKALSRHIWPLDSEQAQNPSSDEEGTSCSLQHETEKKETKARGKKKRSNEEQNNTAKKRGGLNKLYRLSPKLQELTGAEEMGRTDVVKHLWEYIRSNKLQDPTDKRRILCDQSLRSLFNVDSIGMFQMNKELTTHLLPINENASKLQKIEEQEIEENEAEPTEIKRENGKEKLKEVNEEEKE